MTKADYLEEPMNRPKVVLYVCASVDGRITMGSNTTMFDSFTQPELFDMLCSRQEWEKFSRLVFDLHKPDIFLEGSNMVVAENDALAGLPAFVGDPEALYGDFLPDEILRRPGRRTWTSVVDGRGRFRNGYTAECDDPDLYGASDVRVRAAGVSCLSEGTLHPLPD